MGGFQLPLRHHISEMVQLITKTKVGDLEQKSYYISEKGQDKAKTLRLIID